MLLDKLKLNNTIIYPYGYEFAPILSGLLKQKRVDSSTKVISPAGWGINGLDAGEAFGRPKLGIKVLHDFYKEIIGCNIFIVAPFDDTNTNITLMQTINEYISYSKSLGLEIIDLRKIVEFDPINKTRNIEKSRENKISVPVVFVNGIMEHVNKLDVIFELGNALINKGYSVCQIGTRKYCGILGMYPFPEFMYEARIEKEKVVLFKSHIINICEKDKPDILFIGIPGASIPFNDDISNGYGILNFLISLAVHPDFSFTCTNYEYWDNQELSTLYSYRFGHSIDCIVVSNTKITYNPIEHPNKLLLETLDHSRVNYIIKNHPKKGIIPMYNIFNENDIANMANYLIDQLSSMKYFAV